MKIFNNKKKYIYLISPNKLKHHFYDDLKKVLSQKKIQFFQLRLKNETFKKKLIIARKIKKICKFFRVKFLINDDPILAKIVNADGCHLGQKDKDISEARKLLGKKIIGITCHNSIKLSKLAYSNSADYIAIGAFFSSKTKKVKYRASITLLKKVKKITKIPIIAIGGIDNKNYKKLLLNNADFLAISGYIWKNKKLKPLDAIKKFI